jgi:hypothetical protein
MKKLFRIAACLLLAVAGSPRPAQGEGALVSASMAAAYTHDHTSPSYAGGIIWRFNRVLGIGIEITHVRGLRFDGPLISCCGDIRSRQTSFTTNVRVEIPTISTRVVPFLVGGGGPVAVTTVFPVLYAQGPLLADLIALGLSTSPIVPGASRLESTTAGMALTLGGGTSLLVGRHSSIDVDLRVFHTTGMTSGNIGRFGVGASYRF